MHDLPAQMHPRYQEFSQFMQPCPYRKTPSEMQTAFWVWIEKEIECFFCERPDPRDDQIAELKADLDRLHRDRDNFQQQCSAMAEENLRLMQQIENIKTLLDNGVICERGDACLSVDGG